MLSNMLWCLQTLSICQKKIKIYLEPLQMYIQSKNKTKLKKKNLSNPTALGLLEYLDFYNLGFDLMWVRFRQHTD